MQALQTEIEEKFAGRRLTPECKPFRNEDALYLHTDKANLIITHDQRNWLHAHMFWHYDGHDEYSRFDLNHPDSIDDLMALVKKEP